ncbi:Hypothetical predicted protein [Cloeon dipterum]|uniref:Uncharacterized protein n=1 Tax=Cloeon dipterum TaxID=197152 RepID=A0A8S1DHM4_9INSE|nr:Hypothetical predicted protein [Cloeon dipterum]
MLMFLRFSSIPVTANARAMNEPMNGPCMPGSLENAVYFIFILCKTFSRSMKTVPKSKSRKEASGSF